MITIKVLRQQYFGFDTRSLHGTLPTRIPHNNNQREMLRQKGGRFGDDHVSNVVFVSDGGTVRDTASDAPTSGFISMWNASLVGIPSSGFILIVKV